MKMNSDSNDLKCSQMFSILPSLQHISEKIFFVKADSFVMTYSDDFEDDVHVLNL